MSQLHLILLAWGGTAAVALVTAALIIAQRVARKRSIEAIEAHKSPVLAPEGQADMRIEQLEQLIARADRKITELRELTARLSSDFDMADEAMLEQAQALGRQGLDNIEIARRLQLRVGEVELILNLSRQKSDAVHL